MLGRSSPRRTQTKLFVAGAVVLLLTLLAFPFWAWVSIALGYLGALALLVAYRNRGS